ncbi:asparaginase [Chromobacterium subtsugae]|uniref:Asparaginase n=1 Tax=Chromobacterium subtsugae TaxID=251747 RepID=A0ABS7FC41_9NEIS|nr:MULTISPECIES: asparaginase [Chromobacterium]KUM01657.1 L-asparaginase [Chromobacterium subtsugae]KZE84530.1 L-asparaginase 1 [Chromobacterium sp. F49]MBW7566220.1 asparaginase [Chromobacterium subtsugae]MBW8287341.1 asparaginase [Chromobacterium subtsugae]OBU87483.1 L-asparaginase [Chromobacterium subtsugae]
MSRILVLYTGGTIGMDHTPDGLAPVPGLLPRLLQRFVRPGLEFDVVEFEQLIDSSVLVPSQWNQIIDALAPRYDAYDGFVVIHGTDTMAYTASVLAFALQGWKKPVVLTGAQLPLVHPRSDGWANLADALEAACQPDLHEVAVAFDRLLLRGCRARKLDVECFAGFNSPNDLPLAEFAIHAHWHKPRWLPGEGERRAQRVDENLKLAALMLTPGHGSALAGQVLQREGLDGAILLCYGSGNAPADPALLAGVAAMTARGCPVLTLTQVARGGVEVGAYAASQPLARAGALPGADLTPEAALAKLQVLLSAGLAWPELAAGLVRPLRGELSA